MFLLLCGGSIFRWMGFLDKYVYVYIMFVAWFIVWISKLYQRARVCVCLIAFHLMISISKWKKTLLISLLFFVYQRHFEWILFSSSLNLFNFVYDVPFIFSTWDLTKKILIIRKENICHVRFLVILKTTYGHLFLLRNFLKL